jgi:hypothetical protein
MEQRQTGAGITPKVEKAEFFQNFSGKIFGDIKIIATFALAIG